LIAAAAFFTGFAFLAVLGALRADLSAIALAEAEALAEARAGLEAFLLAVFFAAFVAVFLGAFLAALAVGLATFLDAAFFLAGVAFAFFAGFFRAMSRSFPAALTVCAK
jgi:hypothetical protein